MEKKPVHPKRNIVFSKTATSIFQSLAIFRRSFFPWLGIKVVPTEDAVATELQGTPKSEVPGGSIETVSFAGTTMVPCRNAKIYVCWPTVCTTVVNIARLFLALVPVHGVLDLSRKRYSI